MQDARVSVGPLDFDALAEIRRVFEEEGLVAQTGWDEPLIRSVVTIYRYFAERSGEIRK
jgi:hypothetical protein